MADRRAALEVVERPRHAVRRVRRAAAPSRAGGRRRQGVVPRCRGQGRWRTPVGGERRGTRRAARAAVVLATAGRKRGWGRLMRTTESVARTLLRRCGRNHFGKPGPRAAGPRTARRLLAG